jgi:hypothetical protein
MAIARIITETLAIVTVMITITVAVIATITITTPAIAPIIMPTGERDPATTATTQAATITVVATATAITIMATVTIIMGIAAKIITAIPALGNAPMFLTTMGKTRSGSSIT